jgi:hypothetical protein
MSASAMSLEDFPTLGFPSSRLADLFDDLKGASAAGALSCDDFYAKHIRPLCKGNNLPLVQQILLKDVSTRTSKTRCAPADTLVIQGGDHGFADTFAALALHMCHDGPPSDAVQFQSAEVSARAAAIDTMAPLTVLPANSRSGRRGITITTIIIISVCGSTAFATVTNCGLRDFAGGSSGFLMPFALFEAPFWSCQLPMHLTCHHPRR